MREAGRRAALEALLRGEGDVTAVVSEVRRFGWDAEYGLVTLGRQHIRAILQRLRAGRLTEAEVAAWADGVEAREDVSLEAGYEDLISALIFALANPEINGTLTPELAMEYLVKLEG